MTTHIVINGKELTHPVAKLGVAIAAMLVAAVGIAVVMFVFLPLIGITVAASVGLAVMLLGASLAGVFTLLLGAVLVSSILGPLELLLRRRRKGR